MGELGYECLSKCSQTRENNLMLQSEQPRKSSRYISLASQVARCKIAWVKIKGLKERTRIFLKDDFDFHGEEEGESKVCNKIYQVPAVEDHAYCQVGAKQQMLQS